MSAHAWHAVSRSTASSRRRSRARSSGSGSIDLTACPARLAPGPEARRRNRLTSLEQARRIAGLAQEKLARDVVILDMRPVCTYTDFFVVCTGGNPRQTKAIWDEIYARLKQEHDLTPRSTEGTTEASWIIGDYIDVVAHVFTPEAR